jgi:hypothetical protein
MRNPLPISARAYYVWEYAALKIGRAAPWILWSAVSVDSARGTGLTRLRKSGAAFFASWITRLN